MIGNYKVHRCYRALVVASKRHKLRDVFRRLAIPSDVTFVSTKFNDHSFGNPASLTNREDWPVLELTQCGVASSRYAPGPNSNREAMSAAFDRTYLRAMQLCSSNAAS